LAIASEIIPVFSRKAIFGYPVMVGGHGCHCVRRLWRVACHFFTIGMTATS